jgi:hypothetical protein
MILYYNTHSIPDLIKNGNAHITTFLSEQYSEDLFNTYERFGLNKHNVVYDRTKHIPHYLNITPDLHPMPGVINNYNRSFWKITEERCKELLALGKPINVMWSGGIDSTYILFVLKHFANNPDQVKVYGTYNSILESGDLFDNHIKNKFICDIKVGTYNKYNYQDENSIYVSGMCGNQLFGPTDDFFATGQTAMFHHTLGTPKTIYESYEGNIDPVLLEFLNPIIKTSPKKLETVADLRWYCIFNLDWYTAIYEHKTQIPLDRANRIYGFFNSDSFQEWAINTKEPFTKTKGNSLTHRWQMRDILTELIGDSYYSLHKDKKISTFSTPDPNWLLLLNDYRNVYL